MIEQIQYEFDFNEKSNNWNKKKLSNMDNLKISKAQSEMKNKNIDRFSMIQKSKEMPNYIIMSGLYNPTGLVE